MASPDDVVTQTVELARWQLSSLERLAIKRGSSVGDLLHSAAASLVLAPPAKRAKPSRAEGRVDTIAVKVAALHSAGLTDTQMAAHLNLPIHAIKSKRYALHLLINSPHTTPTDPEGIPVKAVPIRPVAMSISRALEIAETAHTAAQAKADDESARLSRQVRRLNGEGLADTTIAARLGVPPATVKAQRHADGIPAASARQQFHITESQIAHRRSATA